MTYIQWLWTEHGKLALAEVKQPTSSNMYDLPYFIIGNIKKTSTLSSQVELELYSLSSSAMLARGVISGPSYTLLVRALKGVPANQWGMNHKEALHS